MHCVSLGKNEQPRKVLFLGAHCDDIEIGCGATLRSMCRAWPEADMRLAVFSGTDEREAETRTAIDLISNKHSTISIDVHRFANGRFPYCANEIKTTIEGYKSFVPDIIFSHYRGDMHQDHRTISELTGNTFRDHLVLEYEIPKYDGDIGNPNVFVPITEEDLDAKVHALMESFLSQRDKHWFAPDVFISLARLRGVHSASPTGYAEAFFGKKISMVI